MRNAWLLTINAMHNFYTNIFGYSTNILVWHSLSTSVFHLQLYQWWGTYLLSRAARIVHYRCWRAATSINFILKNIFFIWLSGRVTLFTYYLRTCLSWSFVLTRCCTLTWVTKILMRAISNVHAGRRFPSP